MRRAADCACIARSATISISSPTRCACASGIPGARHLSKTLAASMVNFRRAATSPRLLPTSTWRRIMRLGGGGKVFDVRLAPAAQILNVTAGDPDHVADTAGVHRQSHELLIFDVAALGATHGRFHRARVEDIG